MANQLLFAIQVLASWTVWPVNECGESSCDSHRIFNATSFKNYAYDSELPRVLAAAGIFPLVLSTTVYEAPSSSTGAKFSCTAPFVVVLSGRDSTATMWPWLNQLLFAIQVLASWTVWPVNECGESSCDSHRIFNATSFKNYAYDSDLPRVLAAAGTFPSVLSTTVYEAPSSSTGAKFSCTAPLVVVLRGQNSTATMRPWLNQLLFAIQVTVVEEKGRGTSANFSDPGEPRKRCSSGSFA
uniref:Secreted protein n=1 Tax=Ixodes ricinus TaxID=34613 RepID=A0A6B0V503_IXORI